MRRIWPDFDYAAWRRAKLERSGIYNVGLREWQVLLCAETGYAGLAAELRARGHRLSAHHPYVSPWRGHDRRQSSLFLHPDPAARELAFAWLDDSLARAAETGAGFVVTHLADAKEFVETSAARVLAAAALERMARAAGLFGVELHVEFLGYHSTFNDPAAFVEVLAPYPEVRLCLDTGHLQRWAQVHNRDPGQAASLLAPVTASVHLWNISSFEEYQRLGHVPIHPSQRPDQGYADVEWILREVLSASPGVSVIFEPTIRADTSESFVAEGILWVRDLVKALPQPEPCGPLVSSESYPP